MSIVTAAINNNKINLKSFPKEKQEDRLGFLSFTAWQKKHHKTQVHQWSLHLRYRYYKKFLWQL